MTNKVVSGDILSKVEGLDISVKHIDTIIIDSTESPMTITADIVANTLYRHIKSAVEATDDILRLHSEKALKGYILKNKAAFLGDDYIMDNLYAPQREG